MAPDYFFFQFFFFFFSPAPPKIYGKEFCPQGQVPDANLLWGCKGVTSCRLIWESSKGIPPPPAMGGGCLHRLQGQILHPMSGCWGLLAGCYLPRRMQGRRCY